MISIEFSREELECILEVLTAMCGLAFTAKNPKAAEEFAVLAEKIHTALGTTNPNHGPNWRGNPGE